MDEEKILEQAEKAKQAIRELSEKFPENDVILILPDKERRKGEPCIMAVKLADVNDAPEIFFTAFVTSLMRIKESLTEFDTGAIDEAIEKIKREFNLSDEHGR